jgi:hypothetical protein
MAVVKVDEVIGGTGLSGKYGESFTFTRKWRIRVDDPKTSKVVISRAPGIVFNAPHPDFASHRAMEFDLTDEDGVGMFWIMTVKYYIPPKENTPDDTTGMPKDDWKATGSTTTLPCWRDKDGTYITNSAGDPLEGIEIEASDASLTLTKCFADLEWSSIASDQSNTVNDAGWNGYSFRTWKVEFRGATKKEMTVSAGSGTATKPYWETSWEFRYRKDTWAVKPWDVGFNQLVDSSGNPTSSGSQRAAVLGADKKPVRQPVALSNGVAKAAGQKPSSLTFQIYRETNFSVFGTPS